MRYWQNRNFYSRSSPQKTTIRLGPPAGLHRSSLIECSDPNKIPNNKMLYNFRKWFLDPGNRPWEPPRVVDFKKKNRRDETVIAAS